MSVPQNKLSENSYDINLSSLDDILLPQKEKEVENPNEDRYIINSKQVDTHTIIRRRVKLTPAVCDICGFDVAKLAYEQNKLATSVFEDLPEEVQGILQQVVLKHKQMQHTAADNLIVSKSQLKNSKRWLSGRQV